MEKTLGKEIRHQGSKMGWSILGYTLVLNIVVLIGFMLDFAIRLLNKVEENTSATSLELIDSALMASLDNMMSDGTSSIIAVIVGILVLMLVFHKTITIKNIWITNQKMTPKKFLMLISVFMAGQLIFSFVSEGIEALLNVFGYSAIAHLEWATGGTDTISMFLYVGFFGPIAEEIVYRGFVMRSLSKYGKHFAIVCSSFIFGLMHANVHQIFFAMVVGLVLGYVASEYSLKWAVVIHIINNCLFSDILSKLILKLPELWQDIVSYILYGGFFVAALIIMWKHRQEIKAYYQEHKVKMAQYMKFFVSAGMIAFTIIHILLTVVGIQPL